MIVVFLLLWQKKKEAQPALVQLVKVRFGMCFMGAISWFKVCQADLKTKSAEAKDMSGQVSMLYGLRVGVVEDNMCCELC